MIELNNYHYVILIQLVLIFIFSNSRSRWKSRCETIEKERPDDGGGWREEAHFLRRLVDKEAAEAVEEHW